MRSALYFPYTSPESEKLVKNALLLWDELELIVPYERFPLTHENSDVQAALEMIGKPHVPTDDEKEKAHRHLEEMANRNLPFQFYFDHDHQPTTEFYPQKFFPETWEMLRHSRLAGTGERGASHSMSYAMGLFAMSVLADCCAGNTRHRVTDRAAAYANLASALGTPAQDLLDELPAHRERLTHITLEVIDASAIDLQDLLMLRGRETSRGGHDMRDLRHRYVDRLENYVRRLTTETANASDLKEIQRQFREDMADDLKMLKDELRLSTRSALLSKDFLVAALAAIGTVANSYYGNSLPIPDILTVSAPPILTLWGALGAGNKYLAARRSLMKKHPMAYLYELQH